MRPLLVLALVPLLGMGLPTTGTALTVSDRDCAEGAGFVENAARARDNGITRERFVARFDEDLQAIRAFPAPLRWFVQDDDDEALLRAAVLQVFEQPRTPAEHGRGFLSTCRARVTAATSRAG